MENVKLFLEGKKTHLLVVAYLIVLMFTGAEGFDGSLDLSNISGDTVKEALLGLMISSAKAAWDRFSNTTVVEVLEPEI